MIFFVANDGTIVKSEPSPVYQGGANSNQVYLVAPFAADSAATVAFTLPNGEVLPPRLMTPVGRIDGVINKATGNPYSGWLFDLPSEVTRYFGTVTVQFAFYSVANQAVVTASSSTSFHVGRGVPTELPQTPTEDVYTDILGALAALQSQLDNGVFTARSIYPWNEAYSYGVNEIVFYPARGALGATVRSVKADNVGNAPYDATGHINAEFWEVVADFNEVRAALDVVKDAKSYAQAAASSAEDAERSLESAKAQANAAAGSADLSSQYSAEAARQAAAALNSARSAEEFAKRAEEFAKIGLRLNFDYDSVSGLPEPPPDNQTIYMIPNGNVGNNVYDEYVWASEREQYEKIGSTDIDLSAYLKKNDAASTYATQKEVNALKQENVSIRKENASIKKVCSANLYNLGVYDTYVSNEDGTGTVTRKTAYDINGTQFELPVEYTEKVIEDRPLNHLNQDGENWVYEEFTKGLSLLDFSDMLKNGLIRDYNAGIADIAHDTFSIRSLDSRVTEKYVVFKVSLKLNYGKTYSLLVSGYSSRYKRTEIYQKSVSGTSFGDYTGTLLSVGKDIITFTYLQTYDAVEFYIRLWLQDDTPYNAGTDIYLMLVQGTSYYPYTRYHGKIMREGDWLDRLFPIGGNERYIQFPGAQTPAEKFAGTSWEIDTTMQGRTIIGSGGDYVFGAMGGEATHTFTIEEMPSHYHDGIYVGYNSMPVSTYVAGSGGTAIAPETRIYGDAFDALRTGNNGGSQPHNNMQPYVVVNFWKRIA